MPRPKKWRRVCRLPDFETYGPIGCARDETHIVFMTVEELETIRLMDLEGMEQVQCAEMMGVARSTVQRIYNDARKKVAESLVNGKILKIEGGNYKVCGEASDMDECPGCSGGRHRYGRK